VSEGRSPLTERTESAILEAAATVFAEHGAGASMAEVAAAAGIGRATLYRHFPSREALLEALSAAAIAEMAGRLAEAGLERAPVAEAIARIARAIATVGTRYLVLVREQVPADRETVERELAGPIRAVIARGQEEGEIRDDVPAEWLSRLLGGLAGGALNLAAEHGLGIEETSALVVSAFLDGARTRQPKSAEARS
jgi:AcrR family transcriptional regulator